MQNWCSASGDPHYVTWDKKQITYQHKCNVLLARSTARRTNKRPFTVVVCIFWLQINGIKCVLTLSHEVKCLFQAQPTLAGGPDNGKRFMRAVEVRTLRQNITFVDTMTDSFLVRVDLQM